MRSLAGWLEQQQHSHPDAIDLNLERVGAVARRLDLHRPSHRVITVAGTNGKGSTVAYLDGVLRASGVHCGRFTSPHLRHYNERIHIDGVQATDSELIAAFQKIDGARGDITLTFFEYNALAALECFRSAAVEVAVLEVGLGGRLDATNLVDADVAVLCSIGLDHMDWLGDSVEAIGREKAGIFRRGRPAVLGSADMPKSVWGAIEEIGAFAVVPHRDYHAHVHANGWDFECSGVRLRNLPPPAIAGSHQVGNAAAALAALAVGDFGVDLDEATVREAMLKTRIAGRFQVVPGDVEWVLDVAHNVPAAIALAGDLRKLPPAATTIAVCGILGDKDIAGIARELGAQIDAWILVALGGVRAVTTEMLAAKLPAHSIVHAHAANVASACAQARALAKPGDRILVFGSFLTVGPALEFLGL